MKSPKEISLERKLLSRLEKNEKSLMTAELLMKDAEVQALQDYANTVSIKRLGYNDHGPVHMKKVANNAIKMAYLLKDADIHLNLEDENIGSFDDSLTAIVLASYLHDIGMTIGRQDHELFSVSLAYPIIDRLLKSIYPNDIVKHVTIRSLALEGVIGHMGGRKIHSLEAGIILVADGCDMEKGRARIPMTLSTEPRVGDIHKYSSNSIESVSITVGKKKPIRIEVLMSTDVGFFQIEEVLLHKVYASPVKGYIELLAGLEGQELKQYL